jgi:DNA polymerase I-like protein with 3'-5' exonuclease and polymerase domains
MRKKRAPLHYSSGFFKDLNEGGLTQPYDYDWKPPRDLPNLFGERVIGIDTETKDPYLKQNGPGWGYGDGNIVGVSLSTEYESWYLPVAHEVGTHQNLDKDNVYRYLNDLLKDDKCVKVGANLQYDVGWLNQEGIKVRGDLYDVQFAEAVLDDVALSYSLDTIAHKYLRTGKNKSELQDWIDNGEDPPVDFRAAIYRAPPCLVYDYACSDASLPISILKLQWKKLHKNGLLDVFKLESKLIQILIAMRMRGMHVDLDRAHSARDALLHKINALKKQLNEHAE